MASDPSVEAGAAQAKVEHRQHKKLDSSSHIEHLFTTKQQSGASNSHIERLLGHNFQFSSTCNPHLPFNILSRIHSALL